MVDDLPNGPATRPVGGVKLFGGEAGYRGAKRGRPLAMSAISADALWRNGVDRSAVQWDTEDLTWVVGSVG